MRKIIAVLGILCALLWTPHVEAQSGTAPNPDLLTACTQAFIYDASTNGATLVATATGTTQIYVCGWNIWAAGNVNVDLVYGTQSSTPCDTGATKITPAFQFTTQTGNADHIPVYSGLKPVPNGDQLCINTSAGTAVQAIIYYAKF